MELKIHSVRDLIDSSDVSLDKRVVIRALFLGIGSNRAVIADSVKDFYEGACVWISVAGMFDLLFDKGISPIGGGDFIFAFHVCVSGNLTIVGGSGIRYAIEKSDDMRAIVDGKEIRII